MNRRLCLYVAGVVTISAVGFVLLRKQALDRGHTKEVKPAGEVERLRAEIESLKANQSSAVLSTRTAISRELFEIANSRQSVDVPKEEPEQSATEPGSQPTQAEVALQLSNHFDSEPRDPDWSATAEGDARRALEKALPSGTTLASVECKTKLCRVESRHEGLQAFQEYVQVSYMDRDREIWNGAFSVIVTEQSASGVSAVSFITREGEPMPAVE